MDHQKYTFLLIFGTLSVGGCGGHPVRQKLSLKEKGQMSINNKLRYLTINIQIPFMWRILSLNTLLMLLTLSRFETNDPVEELDGKNS
jgi:hypothetical protein